MGYQKWSVLKKKRLPVETIKRIEAEVHTLSAIKRPYRRGPVIRPDKTIPEKLKADLETYESLEDKRTFAAYADDIDDTIEHDELCRQMGRSPLRYLRHLADLTQAELARKTCLSQGFIARVEKNDKKLSGSSRKKIAKALKVPEWKLEY